MPGSVKLREGLEVAFVLVLAVSATTLANEPRILSAEFVRTGSSWRVSVELRHNDTGWEHYADAWRIVTRSGKVIGTRVLRHPHVQEQPFTRSLAQVKIPEGVTTIFIEAHDKVHGWAKQRLKVDLSSHPGNHFRVEDSTSP